MRRIAKLKFISVLSSIASAVAWASVAIAGEAISIETDQTRTIVIPSIPGAIVIGNPLIADVSVQGNKLFVLGRSFGTTNMVVLNVQGEEVANFEISVKHVTDNAVSLYRAGYRQSYNCAPMCESELQIGDEFEYFKTVAEETKKKVELATGQDSAKSEAPPAPQ